MASGCILGTCRYCNELVWEDEDSLLDEFCTDMEFGFYHRECETEHVYSKKLEKRIRELIKENKRLKMCLERGDKVGEKVSGLG